MIDDPCWSEFDPLLEDIKEDPETLNIVMSWVTALRGENVLLFVDYLKTILLPFLVEDGKLDSSKTISTMNLMANMISLQIDMLAAISGCDSDQLLQNTSLSLQSLLIGDETIE